MIGRLQFVWWFWDWQGLKIHDWKDPHNVLPFRYSVILGWLEIRVWKNSRRRTAAKEAK
jgi:hypothetical protein